VGWSWSKICSPICSGGLWFINLIQFNRALLGKWLWRWATDSEALWRSMAETKYHIA